MPIEIPTAGYQELVDQLNSLRTTVRKRALKKALGAMGNLVADAIREAAPVQKNDPRRGDDPHYNITLKDEVRVQVKIQPDEMSGIYSDRVAVFLTPHAEHVARFVEYGHVNKRGKKSRVLGNQTEHGFTDAHPFIRPAFDSTKDGAVELFGAVMADEIEKAMQ